VGALYYCLSVFQYSATFAADDSLTERFSKVHLQQHCSDLHSVDSYIYCPCSCYKVGGVHE
jgi:hypothetical protein